MEDTDELRIQTEEIAGGRKLSIQGELSLRTAGKLRDELIAQLEPGGKTILNAEGITEIDLSGLQLLCSAHRSYQSAKASFEMEGKSPALEQAARLAGFQYCTSTCPYRAGSSDCIWKG